MSETNPVETESPTSTLFSNKKTNGIVALIIAAALGAPVTIFATKDDLAGLAAKEDLDALQIKVDSLADALSRQENHIKAATKTGESLAEILKNKIAPELQRLVTEEQIRKALLVDREKRTGRATLETP